MRLARELIYLSARRKSEVESLTPRQLDIAHLYAEGLSNKEIAQRRGLSPATVRNHLAHVYERLGVHGRLKMARRLDESINGAAQGGRNEPQRAGRVGAAAAMPSDLARSD